MIRRTQRRAGYAWLKRALLGCCLVLASCGTALDSTGTQPAEALATAPARTPEASKPTGSTSAADVIRVTGLHEPESVLHDIANDRYLVSNINGNPSAEDDNGFITWLSPNGAVAEERWINGADPDVTLNAPKGMAIISTTLYVADITVVRRFDLQNGRPLGEIAIPGATFLNDLVGSSDGTIHVSDSGLRASADGFTEAGTDAIYQITPDGRVTVRATGVALGHPNGVALLPDGTLLANTLNASRELYAVGLDGVPTDVRSVPGGQLDGLITLPDGSLLLSSWETNTIYRLLPGGQVETVFSNPDSPAADLGFDAARNRLLIPLFAANAVLIVPFVP
jgi:hypothetical protein